MARDSVLCLENPLAQTTMREGKTSIFGQSFMRCGQMVYCGLMPPKTCYASYNDFMIILVFAHNIHVSKFLEMEATRLYLHGS